MLHQNVRLPDPSFVPLRKPDQQLPPISNKDMDLPTEEMENMLIEGSLKKDQDVEPMKSLLNSAIAVVEGPYTLPENLDGSGRKCIRDRGRHAGG
jgi:hypothetical protein